MMYARALARGARAFASDVVAGLYDSSEVAEFTDAQFHMTDEGDVVIDDVQADTSTDEITAQEASS